MADLFHIVVADDDEDYRFLFKESVFETGIMGTVSFARDGVEVIELLDKIGAPDIIFLDINMPRMDGLTALERIRANEGNGVNYQAYRYDTRLRSAYSVTKDYLQPVIQSELPINKPLMRRWLWLLRLGHNHRPAGRIPIQFADN